MPFLSTKQVNADRLRRELEALGMDSRGPRSDLVNSLEQCGVYSINTDVKPMAKFKDVTSRFPNHSSVLLGNGAQIHCQSDEKLIICNKPANAANPLLEGDFDKKTLQISDCLRIADSPFLCTDTDGVEGDLRRCGNTLYMYRSEGVHSGWYPLQFGTMLLV